MLTLKQERRMMKLQWCHIRRGLVDKEDVGQNQSEISTWK